jgi:hypothetical protein
MPPAKKADIVQTSKSVLNGTIDSTRKGSIAQKWRNGGNNSVVDVVYWFLVTGRHKDGVYTEAEALAYLDNLFGNRKKPRDLPVVEDMERLYAEFFDGPKSGTANPKKAKTKPQKKPPPKKPTPMDVDSDGEGDESADEGEGDESVEDDANNDEEEEKEFVTKPRFDGKGTGQLDHIPDDVVNDRRIFTPLVMTVKDLENTDEFKEMEKKNKAVEKEPIEVGLDPKEYKIVGLKTPFYLTRANYTSGELKAGNHDIDTIATKFGLKGAWEGSRRGHLETLYYSILDIVEDKRFTTINVHTKTLAGVVTNKGLLQFLLGVVGMNLKTVHTLWHHDGRKHFFKAEILKNKKLYRFHSETRSVSNAKQAHGSPTLMYLLNKYAADNKLPLRELKPRNALDVLLIQEFMKRLIEINKNKPKYHEKPNNKIKDNITAIQNIGYVASFLYEVIAGTVKLGDFSMLVDTVIDDPHFRQQLSNAYGDGGNVGKNIIGLYIASSTEKMTLKTTRGTEHELEANKSPIVINEIRMKHFSLILKEAAQERSDANAWKAAACLVEMCTGARITEVLGYADFFAFNEMSQELQLLKLEEIKRKAKDYSLEKLGDAVIQMGVLKRKSKSERKPKDTEEYKVNMKETLAPKPVLFNLTANDIKKLIHVVRSHVYEYMERRGSITGGAMLNTLPPSLFKPLSTQVNTYLHNVMVPDAITNLPLRRDGSPGKMTTHMLRRFYANYSWKQHGTGVTKNVWIMTVLGHDRKGLATSLAYTNATFQEPMGFTPTPSKPENIGIQTFHALEDIKYEMTSGFKQALALVSRQGDSFPPLHSRKRRRNETSDKDKVVAVLVGAPSVIYHTMPTRMSETRIAGGGDDVERMRADVVREYVLKNCRFQKDGHTYLVKPNKTTLLASHFGHQYIDAFLKLEAELVKSMSDEYDGVI